MIVAELAKIWETLDADMAGGEIYNFIDTIIIQTRIL